MPFTKKFQTIYVLVLQKYDDSFDGIQYTVYTVNVISNQLQFNGYY